MSHPLHSEAMKIAETLQGTRAKEVQLASEFSQAQYKLSVIKARIERGLIKKAGDEKALAPSAESRERIFILAREADTDFVAQLQRVNEIQLHLEMARADILSLRDKLHVLLTSMRSEESLEKNI